MNRFRWKLVAGVAAAALVVTVGAGPVSAHDPHSTTPAEAEEEFAVWCAVNSLRLSKGLSALPMAVSLRNNLARPWAIGLAHSRTLSHRGDLFNVTAQQVPGTSRAGENVGNGGSVSQLFNAWLASPTHYANITNPDWEYIGVGMDQTRINAGFVSHYGVQNFASTARTDVTTIMPLGQRFIDVCSNNPFFDDIRWMYDEGITTGFAKPRYREYRPGGNVTRSALAAFLYRVAGSPALEGVCSRTATQPYPFTDVQRGDAFAGEICWMDQQGLTEGATTFRPGANATRGDMAEFMFNLVAPTPEEWTPPPTASFTDVPTTHVRFSDIEWLADAGVSSGYSDGTWRPGSAVTRSAMAAFFHRLDPLLG